MIKIKQPIKPYNKPGYKNNRTISKQDYKELTLYAERCGERNAVDEAMRLYQIRVETRSNEDALQLICGHIMSIQNA